MSVLLVFSLAIETTSSDDDGLVCGQSHLVPCVTGARPSPPWDGDVFSTSCLITAKIMAISGTIGGQVGQIVWRRAAE